MSQNTRSADDLHWNPVFASSLQTDFVSAQTSSKRPAWAAADSMDVPHEVDHRNWSHRTKFPRRSHCATDWANTQLYARFSASLILFTCRLPVGIAWIPRCVFICSAGETCSFFFLFFFPGVIRYKEGDMQVLGWTIVLLCQWILRKVSLLSSWEEEKKSTVLYPTTEMCGCCVWRQTPAFSL